MEIVVMKVCFKCGETQPLCEFYKHPQMADGHLGKCKTCAKKDVQLNYRSNFKHYREYERKRFNDPKRKKMVITIQKRCRARDPVKEKARNAVSNAIRDGRLVRQSCVICGAKSEAHHDDYTKPLDVRWLCFEHHRRLAHGQLEHTNHGD